MANLDSRDKRGSSIGLALPFGRIFPNPNGGIAAADRAQSAYSYDGPSFTVDISIPTAILSGTGTAAMTNIQVIAGGRTIILTLTGTTWITS